MYSTSDGIDFESSRICLASRCNSSGSTCGLSDVREVTGTFGTIVTGAASAERGAGASGGTLWPNVCMPNPRKMARRHQEGNLTGELLGKNNHEDCTPAMGLVQQFSPTNTFLRQLFLPTLLLAGSSLPVLA